MWNFNLEGIQDMYESYEASNLWPFITDTAQGLRVHFVKAEHSTFRWAGQRAAGRWSRCCLSGAIQYFASAYAIGLSGQALVLLIGSRPVQARLRLGWPACMPGCRFWQRGCIAA